MKLNSFYSRKLHSLLGIIPLGAFLAMHLLSNYEAFRGGAEAFYEQAEWINNLPFLLLLEIFAIWLPLLYHGVYGLYIAYEARNNVSNYGYFRNQMFKLQRYTGVITFVFVVWHVYGTRFQVMIGNLEVSQVGSAIHNVVTDPIYLTLYLIGIIAAVFHFTNGLWSFFVSWGIVIGPKAQRVLSSICLILFVAVSVMSVLALLAFRDAAFAI